MAALFFVVFGNFIITQDSVGVFFFLKDVALDSIVHPAKNKGAGRKITQKK